MQSIQTAPEAYSVLSEDPDLAPLVEVFVGKLPLLLESLDSRAAEKDWTAVHRQAYQLKGSSMSYGFDAISILAARLEDACLTNQTEFEILMALNELRAICLGLHSGNRS